MEEKEFEFDGKTVIVKIYDFVKESKNKRILKSGGAFSMKIDYDGFNFSEYEIHLDKVLLDSLSENDKYAVAYHELGHIVNGDFEHMKGLTLGGLNISLSQELNADKYASINGYNLNIKKIVRLYVKRLVSSLFDTDVNIALKLNSINLAVAYMQSYMLDPIFNIRHAVYLKRKMFNK